MESQYDGPNVLDWGAKQLAEVYELFDPLATADLDLSTNSVWLRAMFCSTAPPKKKTWVRSAVVRF